MQDAPSGAPLQKGLSSFTPLESALHHPWNKLSARFTHKLVYALRGECAPDCNCLMMTHFSNSGTRKWPRTGQS